MSDIDLQQGYFLKKDLFCLLLEDAFISFFGRKISGLYLRFIIRKCNQNLYLQVAPYILIVV